jgi:uncharacterized protein YkwD
MRSARAGLLLVFAGILLLLASPASAVGAAESARIVGEINSARGAHGLPPLQHSGALTRSSGRYAHHLMDSQWFGHAPSIRASRRFRTLGEVLSMHGGRAGRPGATVRRWLASSMHRELILSRRFGYVGGATGKGSFQGRRTVIWVVQLGSM